MNPEPDDDAFVHLASSIDDDLHVDWTAAEQSARDESERGVVSELRVLARLASVFRDPDRPLPKEPDRSQAGARQETPISSWGPLKVHEAIGTGAFGTVYRAVDNLNQDVALKLLNPGEDEPAQRKRVLREGRMLARVKHPNVVGVHGVDVFDGRVGLWMEFIRGRTLEDELQRRGVFGAQEARLIGLDLCRALAAVHDAGLVHRDVKAQNVMREAGGRIVLMDFGAGSDNRLTVGGVREVAGTPAYLAPEVFKGDPASSESDIYSLGVLLYHMTTGLYPVGGADRDEIQLSHDKGQRRRLRDARPDLPDGFVQAVESALDPDPLRRHRTAGEFEQALLSDRPVSVPVPTPKPRRPWTKLAAVAATIALAVTTARYWPEIARYWQGNGEAPKGQAEHPGNGAVPPPPPPATEVSYTVSVGFSKSTGSGDVPLSAGDRIRPGDRIGATISASVPLYAYVVNEDERGESYLLFPLPGQESRNPLAPDTTNKLPGRNARHAVQWQVTSSGGREHFLVYTSPTRISAFEDELSVLPSPVEGRPVTSIRLSDATLGRLRGVGGLVPARPASSSVHYLFETASPLTATAEPARGVWVRQLTLQNP